MPLMGNGVATGSTLCLDVSWPRRTVPLLAVLVVAATGFGLGQPAPALIYSGADIARGLADEGTTELLFMNEVTTLTDADFASTTLPIVVRRNVTIRGRPDRMVVLNFKHIKSKLRLGDSVTLTVKNLAVSNFADDATGGASAELFLPMLPNETAILRLEDSAMINQLCFPPYLAETYLGQNQRPSFIPGDNRLDATATLPADRAANGGEAGCRNDSRAPPLERCWDHVALGQDYASPARTMNAMRQFIPVGYAIHLVNTYVLCQHKLDDTCIATLYPIGCFEFTRKRLIAENDTELYAVDVPAEMPPEPQPPPSRLPLAGGDSTAGDADGGGGGGGLGPRLAAVVGCVVGGTALAGIVGAVLLIRRHRLRAGLVQSEDSELGKGRVSGDSQVQPPLDDGNVAVGPAAAGKTVEARGSSGANTFSADFDAASEETGSAIEGHNRDPNRKRSKGSNHKQKRLPSGTQSSSPKKDRGMQPQRKGPSQAQSENVVVSPFTPLRSDLELDSNVAQGVTLLPVVRGKGAYGSVYEGLYGGQRVAVKLMRDLLAGPAAGAAGADGGGAGEQAHVAAAAGDGRPAGGEFHEAAERICQSFAQEVQVMGRCQHPNVVRLLAACVRPPRLCLVMELMDTSLQRMMFGGPAAELLPLPKVLYIATEIACALEYLHPTIVHRDLKPDNVLISSPDSPQPVVKVSDFGLSRLRSTVAPTLHPEAGTPSYMAPECFDVFNNSITHHVDLYAWGVVVWAMLTRGEPWPGSTVVEIAYRISILDERLPLANAVATGRCPRRLMRLLERCWSRIPERRPAAAEIVKEMMLITEAVSNAPRTPPASVLSRIHEYAAAAPPNTSSTTTGGPNLDKSPNGASGGGGGADPGGPIGGAVAATADVTLAPASAPVDAGDTNTAAAAADANVAYRTEVGTDDDDGDGADDDDGDGADDDDGDGADDDDGDSTDDDDGDGANDDNGDGDGADDDDGDGADDDDGDGADGDGDGDCNDGDGDGDDGDGAAARANAAAATAAAAVVVPTAVSAVAVAGVVSTADMHSPPDDGRTVKGKGSAGVLAHPAAAAVLGLGSGEPASGAAAWFSAESNWGSLVGRCAARTPMTTTTAAAGTACSSPRVTVPPEACRSSCSTTVTATTTARSVGLGTALQSAAVTCTASETQDSGPSVLSSLAHASRTESSVGSPHGTRVLGPDLPPSISVLTAAAAAAEVKAKAAEGVAAPAMLPRVSEVWGVTTTERQSNLCR